ncbi:MAG: DNA polymerase I [Clostridia bacterium]|nr:DNA polymerase I [Clostridia bacterium]
MKKILVIDGNSIINRAFYGIRPLTTKSGKHTNAIYGAVNMISKQLEAIKPDWAAVAFDIKHPTFRHKMYEGYKAGRHPTPPELLSQFPDAKECFNLMGIKVLELPGWEADDIQGTIAKMADSREDTESYVFTGDRDLLQLIDGKTTVLLATNSDTVPMRAKEFEAKYGIPPHLFVEMKALMGDSSDNIPGVSGVGEKTAATLIQNFGTLENIYENIEDSRITKGVREKLLRDRDNAFLSRALAKIDTKAPLGLELSDIEYKGFKKAELYEKFSELELNSFITKFKLLEKDEDESTTPCEEIPEVEYKPLSPETLSAFSGKRIAVELFDGVTYLTFGGESYSYTGSLSDISSELSKRELICYDGKALWHKLDASGADVENTVFLDLALYEYVLSPGSGSAGIASLTAMFIGKSVKADTPLACVMEELEAALRAKVSENGLDKVLFELEIPLINVLARMEKTGFKINPRGIEEFRDALGELSEELANRVYMQAGEVFNLNSPKQLGEVLYEKLGLGRMLGKKSGHSTDAQTLEELRPYSPIIDDILEYRQVSKLKSTYTTPLLEARDGDDRIHTDFKQALTATGRLSSADPNLQNIPIKTKMGRELRRFFIAKEGYMLVDADYSQIELRLLAHISDDYNMKEAFVEGIDIHKRTAAAVFGVPEESVTPEMRKRAKAVNFGIVYGIGGFSLAKDIGTSVREASQYIKNYLMNYPAIDVYLEEVVKEAEERGYTVTLMGRRRYIPELRAAKAQLRAFGKRVAMNAPIQGTAADVMKLAMLNVSSRLKSEGLDAELVMQVHDELIVEAADSCAARVAEILREEMENTVELTVPLTVDVTMGKNWLEQE